MPGLVSTLSAPISLPDPEIQAVPTACLPLRASQLPQRRALGVFGRVPRRAVGHAAPEVVPYHVAPFCGPDILHHTALHTAHSANFTRWNKPPNYFGYFELNPAPQNIILWGTTKGLEKIWPNLDVGSFRGKLTVMWTSNSQQCLVGGSLPSVVTEVVQSWPKRYVLRITLLSACFFE